MKAKLTNAERLDRSVTEAELQSFVQECCERWGWLYHHNSDSRRSTAGLPDVIAVKEGRIVVAELKSELGKVSRIQQVWLQALETCDGVETYLWRPSCLDEIVRTFQS